MDPCPFCELAAGHVPAAVVLSTESVIAFLDHSPLFPGHTLLIPRDHVATLEDLPSGLAAPFLVAASRLARAVRTAARAQGTFVGMNNVGSARK